MYGPQFFSFVFMARCKTQSFAFTYTVPKSVTGHAFTMARTAVFAQQHHDHIPVSLDRIVNSYLFLSFALDWTVRLKSSARCALPQTLRLDKTPNQEGGRTIRGLCQRGKQEHVIHIVCQFTAAGVCGCP